jgi:hypothetical protein
MPCPERGLLVAMPAVVVAVVLSSSCSRNDGRRALRGTVTLDGQPVACRGTINFRPASGNARNSSGAALENNGCFSIPAANGLLPGKYAVTISLWKDTGRTRKDARSGEVFAIWDKVPFKEEGTLNVVVTTDGADYFDFNLTSVH